MKLTITIKVDKNVYTEEEARQMAAKALGKLSEDLAQIDDYNPDYLHTMIDRMGRIIGFVELEK